MTSTTTPLFQRLDSEAPRANKLFQEALIKLTVVGMQLPRGSAEDHDWFKALNDMADALGMPDVDFAYVSPARPETTDTRPLYQRVEDVLPADALHQAQSVCFALGTLAVAIQVEAGIELGQEFLTAANVFMGPDGLGLPIHATVATYSGVDLGYETVMLGRKSA